MDRLPKELMPSILSYSAWDPCRRVCKEWRNFMAEKYGEENYLSCRRSLSLRNHNYQIGVIMGIFFLKYRGKYIYWALAMNILSVVIDNKRAIILHRLFFKTKEITFVEGAMALEIQKDSNNFKEHISGFQWEFIFKREWFNRGAKDVPWHDDMIFFLYKEKLYVLSKSALVQKMSCEKPGEYISYRTGNTYHWLKMNTCFYERLFDNKRDTCQTCASVLFVIMSLQIIYIYSPGSMPFLFPFCIYLAGFHLHELYVRFNFDRKILLR